MGMCSNGEDLLLFSEKLQHKEPFVFYRSWHGEEGEREDQKATHLGYRREAYVLSTYLHSRTATYPLILSVAMTQRFTVR